VSSKEFRKREHKRINARVHAWMMESINDYASPVSLATAAMIHFKQQPHRDSELSIPRWLYELAVEVLQPSTFDH